MYGWPSNSFYKSIVAWNKQSVWNNQKKWQCFLVSCFCMCCNCMSKFLHVLKKHITTSNLYKSIKTVWALMKWTLLVTKLSNLLKFWMIQILWILKTLVPQWVIPSWQPRFLGHSLEPFRFKSSLEIFQSRELENWPWEQTHAAKKHFFVQFKSGSESVLHLSSMSCETSIQMFWKFISAFQRRACICAPGVIPENLTKFPKKYPHRNTVQANSSWSAPKFK